MSIARAGAVSTGYLLSVEVGEPSTGNRRVLVEIDPQPGLVPAGRAGDVVIEASRKLRDSLRDVTGAAQALIDEAAALATQPQRVNVQFGVKLTGESNAVVAKVGGEANFILTLEWKLSDGAAPAEPSS